MIEKINAENVKIAKNILSSAQVVNNGQNTYSKYFNSTFNVNGTPKKFKLEQFFINTQGNIPKIVELSKYYYNKNGLIMRTINIERDFGSAGFRPVYPTSHKKVKKIIEDYNKKININQLIKDMIFELALAGNLICYDRGDWIDIYSIGEQVEISDYVLNGKPLVFYNTINELSNHYTSFDTYQIDPSISETYPKEVFDAMMEGKAKAILNNRNTYVARINGSRYEKYGIPPLLPALDDLSHKNLMTEAERSTALSVINKILLFQIGDKENPPTDSQITYYSEALGTKDGSIEMTVPYFVDGKFIEPSTEVFAASATIQANIEDSLLGTLGISLTLIKGEGGGTYSENQVNLSGLTKSINAIRELIKPIINDLYKKLLLQNNIPLDNCPEANFDEVVIDASTRKEILTWLFTTAGLSYESLYEGLGLNYLEEKSRRDTENEEKLEDIFKLREQPFQGNQGKIGGGNSSSGNTNSKGNPVGGRPTKTDKKSTNNDTPRPSSK